MKHELRDGMRDGIPIGIGYLAVSFSLGIAARNAGMTPLQGFLASILLNASAGEYAGFMAIASGVSYIEAAFIILIANARYFLMSCAISQRLAPGTPLRHRLLMGYDVADELFGITIARPGYINPYYTYGAVLVAAPCWAFGTALGVSAGNLLPSRVVSALGAALFGMFLSVIIPSARSNKIVALFIGISFAASYAAGRLPVLSSLSDGTRTMILTVVIAGVAAAAFPIEEKAGEENGS